MQIIFNYVILISKGGVVMPTDRAAAFRYLNEYQKENYDRITIIVPKGRKKEIQATAKRKGMSTSEYIVACIEQFERGNNK